MAATWQDVLAQAAARNNEIKSAQKQLEAYQWLYYKSYSEVLPQISANLSGGNTVNSLGNSTSYSYGLSASQALFKGFSNYFNVRTAAVNYDFYRANLVNIEADYYNQVRLTFIDLYLAQQNLAVRKTIKQSRDNNARMIKLFYESGKEDKGNYLRTVAQAADADQGVSSALRQLELARLKLSQLVNETVASIEGEPAVGQYGLPDIGGLVKNSPAFIMAKDQLELASIAQQNTLGEFLPTVILTGAYQKSGSDWPPTSASKALSKCLFAYFPRRRQLC